MNRTVLVVGADMGFGFWLCRALDQAGYDAFPARGTEAASETISEFHLSPGLIILTNSLPQFNEFLLDLKRSQEHPCVLYLAEPGKNGDHAVADKIYPRPAKRTEEAKAELLKVVSAVLVDNPVPADKSR